MPECEGSNQGTESAAASGVFEGENKTIISSVGSGQVPSGTDPE